MSLAPSHRIRLSLNSVVDPFNAEVVSSRIIMCTSFENEARDCESLFLSACKAYDNNRTGVG